MIFIGHGTAGCKLATQFSTLNGFPAITIDSTKGSKVLLPKCKTMEEQEEKTPNLIKALKKIKDEEVVFITAGGGITSGSVLKILEQIKDNTIDIIFIRPDIEQLNKDELLRLRVTFNVLQEMTRSGTFRRIYLVDNKVIANLCEDILIENYYEKINDKIVYVFNYLNYILSQESSLRNNLTEPDEACRVCSFGVYDFEEECESLFFDLKHCREKQILYSLTQEAINSKSLIDKISNQMKMSSNEDVNATYKLIKGSQDRVFLIAFSKMIQ